MDPQLWEEIARGAADRSIRALLRLYPGKTPPAEVEIISTFGDILTCRVKRSDIIRVRSHPSVRSLKAARGLEPSWSPPFAAETSGKRGLRRRPSLRETGRGVLVGVIDYGCDFGHWAFRKRDGATRIRSLWHQGRSRDTSRAPAPFDYGREWDSDAINTALKADDPYRALGYHPSRRDNRGRRKPSHGTHVMDIAAGSGRSHGPTGLAPGADIAFCHVDSGGTSGLLNFGDSVGVLEALDHIIRVAGEQPTAVNISLGRHGGPHDGSSLCELAMDHVLMTRRGLSIAQSAGNYYGTDIHCAGRMRAGQGARFEWRIQSRAPGTKELEIWISAEDSVGIELRAPDGSRWDVPPGARVPIERDGVIIGRAYHRLDDPGNGDTHIDVFFYDEPGADGMWSARMSPRKIVDGRWHAWLERHGSRLLQTRFTRGPISSATTGGTIAHGRGAIQVAAHRRDTPNPITRFSSAGPTRDGREVPMIAAPGEDVWAARSALNGRSTGREVFAMPGTSMAAPHVTGTIALMLEAAPALTQRQIRRILRNTALSIPVDARAEGIRSAWGRLAPAAAVRAARKASTSPAEPLPRFADHETADQTSSTVVTQAEWALVANWTAQRRVPTDGTGVLPMISGLRNVASLPVTAIDAARATAQAILNHRHSNLSRGRAVLQPLPRQSTITNARLDPLAQQLITAMPLSLADWRRVGGFIERQSDQNRTAPATTRLFGTDDAQNRVNIAHHLSCHRLSGFPGFTGPAQACGFPQTGPVDPGTAIMMRHLQALGPVPDWPEQTIDQRRLYIMRRLIEHYNIPVNSAAGIVGNLDGESRLLPEMVESGSVADPRHALSFRGPRQRFSAANIMNRSHRANRGPRMPGIGLAQWTHRARRPLLFNHRYHEIALREFIVYLMDPQIDVLISELASNFRRLDRLLRNPRTTLDQAADEFVYDYERPGSIGHPDTGARLPRTDSRVQAVFNRRRRHARSALRALRAAEAEPQPETQSTAQEEFQ